MENQPNSCWSLTIKAVAAIALMIVVIWLADIPHGSALLANAG